MAYSVKPRQEQFFFPQLPREDLAPVPARPQNFARERPQNTAQKRPQNLSQTGESTLNNAMQLQICDQIRMLGKLQQAAEDTHALLLAENASLKQQIPQRLEALESEWLSRAENLSTKVDIIYHKLTQFHRQFCAQAQEAHSLCLEKNPLRMISEKRKVDCVVSDDVGFAVATRTLYLLYSKGIDDDLVPQNLLIWLRSETLLKPKIPENIKQLHLTLRGSLKAVVKAEISRIKAEKMRERAVDTPIALQRVAASRPNKAVEGDVGDVFQSFVQKLQAEIQVQEERNLLIRKENEWLKNKENQIKVDGRFLRQFYADSFLQPLFKLHDISQRALAFCCEAPLTKRAPTIMAELSPSEYYYGVNLGFIEVGKKINEHFNEIITLVEALEGVNDPNSGCVTS